ncbi:MAG: sulfate permease [Deltaproteobacteria bacterium]|nr:sulfate permease [Deltaproteobacteria bacterium]
MIRKWIPALGWLQNYHRTDLKGDLSAGGVVAIMLIPQGMAYAMLAGLPPVYGLYASTLPLIVYALMGSSRHLAVGPVAIISLLVFSSISELAEPGSEQYIRLVLLLTLMVGGMQLLLGFLRLGFFINFFSHAVISGFTSAAAIIILLSQVGHLFGIPVSSGHSAIHLLQDILSQIHKTHPMTLAVGSISLGTLFFFKKRHPHFPAPLLVVIASTLTAYFVKLDRWGLKIVGHVPRGLPDFNLPPFSIESFSQLFPTALTILFVGFMESISVATWIAGKERYSIDSNQELKGLGLANIAASFFSAYPVTGGLSRTAVNYESGARTGLASMISASIVILILLFFTSLFHSLPKAALAAIVIVAVTGLIDVKGLNHLFKIKKTDGWVFLLTCLATLLLGSEKGILMGMVFSLLVFIWRSAHPHVAELGYLKEEKIFRNIKRYPEAQRFPDALILRVDASLYFANMSFLKDILQKRLAETPVVKWVILDLSGVNDMDGVAIDSLEEMMKNYGEKEIRFIFTDVKGPVRDLISKAGWEDTFGRSIDYPTLLHALRAIQPAFIF